MLRRRDVAKLIEVKNLGRFAKAELAVRNGGYTAFATTADGGDPAKRLLDRLFSPLANALVTELQQLDELCVRAFAERADPLRQSIHARPHRTTGTASEVELLVKAADALQDAANAVSTIGPGGMFWLSDAIRAGKEGPWLLRSGWKQDLPREAIEVARMMLRAAEDFRPPTNRPPDLGSRWLEDALRDIWVLVFGKKPGKGRNTPFAVAFKRIADGA